MYELDYVRKRKRRRRVAIVGGISAMVVTTLGIVAFLGRYSGTFTVSLESKDVQLTLSTQSNFETRSSFLRVKDVPSFQEYTYCDFRKIGDSVIDSEETTVDLGLNAKGDALDFFKYTFFVKNVGTNPAKYDISLNILENVAGKDGRSLEDTVRVSVFDNGNKTVYAKRASTPHMDGDKADYRAPISVDESEATDLYPFEGYAEMFVSSKVITNSIGVELDVGEVRRYTVVTWLEGFRSSNRELAPEGATIKLGVEINAYENE